MKKTIVSPYIDLFHSPFIQIIINGMYTLHTYSIVYKIPFALQIDCVIYYKRETTKKTNKNTLKHLLRYKFFIFFLIQNDFKLLPLEFSKVNFLLSFKFKCMFQLEEQHKRYQTIQIEWSFVYFILFYFFTETCCCKQCTVHIYVHIGILYNNNDLNCNQ